MTNLPPVDQQKRNSNSLVLLGMVRWRAVMTGMLGRCISTTKLLLYLLGHFVVSHDRRQNNVYC